LAAVGFLDDSQPHHTGARGAAGLHPRRQEYRIGEFTDAGGNRDGRTSHSLQVAGLSVGEHYLDWSGEASALDAVTPLVNGSPGRPVHVEVALDLEGRRQSYRQKDRVDLGHSPRSWHGCNLGQGAVVDFRRPADRQPGTLNRRPRTHLEYKV